MTVAEARAQAARARPSAPRRTTQSVEHATQHTEAWVCNGSGVGRSIGRSIDTDGVSPRFAGHGETPCASAFAERGMSHQLAALYGALSRALSV